VPYRAFSPRTPNCVFNASQLIAGSNPRRGRCRDPCSGAPRHRRRPANEADRRQPALPCREPEPARDSGCSDVARGHGQLSCPAPGRAERRHLASEVRKRRNSSVPVEPRLASGSFDILMAAACQGAGIALLPATYYEQALATGTLVRVLPKWSGGDGILHLVFVSRRGMLPGVRAVIDFAAAALRSSVVP
jgi:DNA-binding transcriptional LysR family regulator